MTETAAAFQSTVLDQRFRFRENRTTLGRDTVAGVMTFTAISYIIFLDPQILGFAGIAPPEERPSLRRRPRDPRAASQSTRWRPLPAARRRRRLRRRGLHRIGVQGRRRARVGDRDHAHAGHVLHHGRDRGRVHRLRARPALPGRGARVHPLVYGAALAFALYFLVPLLQQEFDWI